MAAGSASSGMSQNLSRRALCESCFARGYENEDRGQTGHGSPGSAISQNYSFLRTRSVTVSAWARSVAPITGTCHRSVSAAADKGHDRHLTRPA
jgi:hypothetical protein